MSAIILDNELVHYEVLGRGRPLIFLHGWVGSWRYWIPSMQAASLQHRSYALDMWGFGDTSKRTSAYGLSGQIDLLEKFLEKLGIGKIALIGHGLGSIVSLLFAEKNPDRVDRVMAIGYPLGLGLLNTRLANASPVDLSDWLLARNPGAEAARQEAPKTDGLALQNFYQSLEENHFTDLRILPGQIITPCLLVHGVNDPAIRLPQIDNMSTQPEHTHYITFEESGHFPMVDETSKFNRLLTDFLSLESGESPKQLQLKEEWKRRVR